MNVSVKEYGKILLGLKDHDEMKKIIDYDFERNTMNLKNYLKKFRIQDANQNEYEWRFKDNVEDPVFEYKILRPFDWNRKSKLLHLLHNHQTLSTL